MENASDQRNDLITSGSIPFNEQKGTNMVDFQISFMENSDIQESAEVLSLAMIDNPLHVAVFQGNSENERLEIETMFYGLLIKSPGIVFLAKAPQKIVGVMRMKSCMGRAGIDESNAVTDENDIRWRKSVWHKEWATHDLLEQHWHLGPIGVLPSHVIGDVRSDVIGDVRSEHTVCNPLIFGELIFIPPFL